MSKLRGDQIYVRTLSASRVPSATGREWQYHSRSDAHSKAACWGIVFDLLATCSLFKQHVQADKVGFGINHTMRDFRMNRKKNLDLVICTPRSSYGQKGTSFAELADQYRITLNSKELEELTALPILQRSDVGSVLVALEAKACMTEHIKACPRLYDELSSSFQTIHGDSTNAIASAFVTINAAAQFLSPVRNKDAGVDGSAISSSHDQPKSAKRVLEKIMELPRRSGEDGVGYDALGALFVECRNDGSEVSIVKTLCDGTEVNSIINYQSMIGRIATSYTSRFRGL